MPALTGINIARTLKKPTSQLRKSLKAVQTCLDDLCQCSAASMLHEWDAYHGTLASGAQTYEAAVPSYVYDFEGRAQSLMYKGLIAYLKSCGCTGRFRVHSAQTQQSSKELLQSS